MGKNTTECRRMRLNVEGPDINKSRWRYYGISGDLNSLANRGTIVVGFMAIKGVTQHGIEAILYERARNGDYKSLSDFTRRVKPGRDDIIALCPAGVFDSISDGMDRTAQARELLKANAGETYKGQSDLFVAESEPEYTIAEKSRAIAVLMPAKKANDNSRLWEEYRALGFLRRLHPLALWKDRILRTKRIKAYRLGEYVGQFVNLVGWPVTQKEVWTKDGLTMSFLTFEDETALYETVIFPNVYDQYNKLLFDQQPLIVSGVVTEEWGAVSVEVRCAKGMM